MFFLPQLLYLLQNTPLFLLKSFFKQLDSIILPFIWNYKNHRINQLHLSKPRSVGGLAFPDFRCYYWAADLRIISIILNNKSGRLDWLRLEQDECTPYNLGAVILSPTSCKKQMYRSSPVISSVIRIWKQIRTHFGVEKLPLLIPIADNPSFIPSILDKGFQQWRNAGIHTVSDLFQDGTFMSFEKIQEKYKLHRSNFFRFLQVRNYVQAYLDRSATISLSCLDTCLKDCFGKGKIISCIYNALQASQLPTTSPIKRLWEEELGSEISNKVWADRLEEINRCSINSRHCLIQFKILHRLHYSKTKLSRIFPGVSPKCDKCKTADATLLHSYALCSSLQSFWCKIFDVISKMTGQHFEPDEFLIVFGVSKHELRLSKSQQRFLSYGLLTAKKLILTFWKNNLPPPFQLWLDELTYTLHLEHIRLCLSNRRQQFSKTWEPYIRYLGEEGRGDLEERDVEVI